MALRCYSVRFMIGRGGARTESYTVPAGTRAVVRALAFTKWGTVNSVVYFRSHGIVLLQQVLQVTGQLLYLEQRLTLYAGETMAVIVDGPDASYAVDGFLYLDDQLEPDDADNVITPIKRAELMPAATSS